MEIKKLGIFFPLVLSLAFGGKLIAQDLPKRALGKTPVTEYIESALKNDARLAAKKLALESALAALESLEHPSFIVAGAGTGSANLSAEGDLSAARLESAPWLELQLGGNLDTTIKATASNSFPLGTLSGSTRETSLLKPGITVIQPLNQLFFMQTDLAVLKARNAVKDAINAVSAREAECAAGMLGALRDWASAQNELVQKTSALISAQDALKAAVSLKNYKAGSAALSRLENAVTLAAAARERAKRSEKRKAELVGLLCKVMPEENAPEAPESTDPKNHLVPENSIAFGKALAALEYARIGYEQEWGKISPSISAFGNLGCGISYNGDGVAVTTGSGNGVSAELGASVSYKTLAASASAGWNNVSETAWAGLSFSWKDTSDTVEKNNRLAAATELRILEINCKTSLADAKTAIDDFLLADALDSLDTVRLAAALQDAAFSLYETRDLFAGGLATQSDVDESTLAYFNAQASVENARWARAIRLANVPAAWTNTNSAGTGASNED